MEPLPLSFTLPKGIPFDAEVMAPDAAEGGICNRYGDIRGADGGGCHSIVKAGVVYVTKAQAEEALWHGWEIWGECGDDAELIQIARK